MLGDDDCAHPYAVAFACSYKDASWAHTINRSGSRRWYSSVRRAWLSCTLFRSNASRGSMTLMGRGNLRLSVQLFPGGRTRPRSAAPSGRRRRQRYTRALACGPAATPARFPARCRRVPWRLRILATSPRRDCARRAWVHGPIGRGGSGSSLGTTGSRTAPSHFGCGDVNLGVRKVRDAADVVHVEMRDDDVADVCAGEPESLDLAQRRFVVVEHRFEEVARGSDRGRGRRSPACRIRVSTRTRPLSVSTSSTWQTIVGTPYGCIVPQLRWWTFTALPFRPEPAVRHARSG